MKPLLQIRGLRIGFRRREREVFAVNGVDLDVGRGETVALVGESGCGKSLTALSIMGLLGHGSHMPDAFVAGDMRLDAGRSEPENLVGLSRARYDELRGPVLSMVFQEPMSALNPLLTVGEQVAETLVRHQGMKRSEARTRALALLEDVGIPDAAGRLKSYPFQLSGGQRQRVMIAAAMACDPALLIADEPTTALDVTIQSQIVYLLKRIKAERGTSILFITHNLGLVAQLADRVAVMYRGVVVESGTVEQLFREPRHPYTRMLLRALPGKSQRAVRGDRLDVIPGTVPGPSVRIDGCPFHPRCPDATERCASETPAERRVGDGHTVRCLLDERQPGGIPPAAKEDAR